MHIVIKSFQTCNVVTLKCSEADCYKAEHNLPICASGALREMLHYILNLMMVDKDTVILHWFTQSQSHVNIKVTNYNCYINLLYVHCIEFRKCGLRKNAATLISSFTFLK